MKFMPERRLLCALGKKLWERGFAPAADGTLSLRAAPDRILLTPDGVSKSALTPDMIVLVDDQGEPLDEGCPWPPSSEIALHLMCLQIRAGIGGVCSARPPAATAYAAARRDLPARLLEEVPPLLGPIPCAQPVSLEIEDRVKAVRPHLLTGKGVLLAQYGAITLGRTPEEAYEAMERLEHTALVSLYAGLLGGLS